MLGQQLVHWAIYGFGYGLVIGANNAAHPEDLWLALHLPGFCRILNE
jgi:hypothetical protein